MVIYKPEIKNIKDRMRTNIMYTMIVSEKKRIERMEEITYLNRG